MAQEVIEPGRYTGRDTVFCRAIRGEKVPYTPVWLMRQAGRYMSEYRELRSKVSFLELCYNSELAAEVTVHACQEIGADAAILFADILLIVQPLGFDLDYVKGKGPQIYNPVRTTKDVERISTADISSLSPVYDAVRLIRRDLPQEKSLIGFAGAPFTVASYMIEGGPSKNFLEVKNFMHQEPKAWHSLMEKLSEVTLSYLKHQVEAGADALQLFDSWVGCLEPRDYKEFVLPHSERILKGLPAEIPKIHFGKGTSNLLTLMRDAGADVVGVDYATDLAWARKELGPDCTVQGNFDPSLLYCSQEVIQKRVQEILDAAGTQGHIFNLGHGILPTTPVENVKYLIEQVHRISREKNRD